MASQIYETSLPGLLRIRRDGDEIVSFDQLTQKSGRNFEVKQINHSRSVAGVMRGLHAENWDKVVWVPRGKAFSAIVDIRPESPTFGKYEAFELSDENRQALYLPAGFANSIFALTDVDYLYMVTKLYDGTDTTAVAWDDPDIGVAWPSTDPIISKRDLNNPRLRELFPNAPLFAR
jgi:dTDP-4-dehydrorhamnose 3,5-epimerase